MELLNKRGLNKRGAADNILPENIAYFVFLILFFIGMFYWVVGLQDGAAKWEDFYSKEIAKVINLAEPGQEVYLDVTRATEIALKNGKKLDEIFVFDNANNKILVSFQKNGATAFTYFNDVDVIGWKVELISGDIETNRLYFKIVEAQK